MYGKFCILLSIPISLKKQRIHLYYLRFFNTIRNSRNHSAHRKARFVFMSKIRKIAVFISHIYGDYQHGVCQGVIDKATEFGYHVDIFVSNDEKVLGKYASGESGILQVPNPEAYEGVLLSSGTYLLPNLREQILSTLQEWNCPVIDINSVPSPFPGVLLNNNSPIGELVRHLGKVHGCKNICYLGNTLESYISNSREYHYTTAMTQMGLSDNIVIAAADYSEQSIQKALDTLLASDPQAIVCYNDAMAFSVMGELADRGISVPEQIAVTGCDNLDFGRHISPSLTTVTFPAYELGEQALIQLLQQLDHNAPEQPPVITAAPRYGGSCGCAFENTESPILFSNRLRSKINTLESIYLQDMHMSASLQGITDIDTAMDALAGFLQTIGEDQGVHGLKECYLCLYSDWEQISRKIRRLTLMEEAPESDKILLKLALKNHVRLPECTFSPSDSLPDFVRKNGSQVYVFTPLYFGSTTFGYLCEAFENNRISYPFSFVSWLQNVNSMLQTVSNTKNMQLMLDRLENIYRHDSLTGLLNLQSFHMMLPGMLEQARKLDRGAAAVVLDLDHLKQINDSYGHEEGNFAIKVLGQAIRQVCNGDISACRFGGDEFYLLGIGLNEKDAQEIILRIQKYLEHYNDNGRKPYSLRVSGGCAAVSSYTEEDLMDAFKQADRNMYRQKQLGKS